jgi:hypothetical protein
MSLGGRDATRKSLRVRSRVSVAKTGSGIEDDPLSLLDSDDEEHEQDNQAVFDAATAVSRGDIEVCVCFLCVACAC